MHDIAVTDITPIQQAPIRMTGDQERWVEQWTAEQLRKGLVVKAGLYEHCPVVTALLLVPGAQHGQAYRVVQNLVPLNKRTRIMQLPCRDVRRCRAMLGRAKYLSQVDLKAGYYNVPLAAESQRLTAFSTHGGTYYWTRMTQGL